MLISLPSSRQDVLAIVKADDTGNCGVITVGGKWLSSSLIPVSLKLACLVAQSIIYVSR